EDDHGVAAVVLFEQYADVVLAGCRDVLADHVGADGELSVAAVDEDRAADGARPSVVVQRVQGGADRAAGHQHVVHQHHHLPVDVREVGGVGRGVTPVQVVAVEGHVQGADGGR